MAHDESVANRVRHALSKHGDFQEKRMFGGLTFMVRGHMCCGIVGSELMVRVGPDGYSEALGRPHARRMDFTGRPLTGMVYVGAAGFRTRAGLDEWVERALTFNRSLARRPPGAPAPKSRPGRSRS